MSLMDTSFPVGHLAGIAIRIHATFPLVFLFAVLVQLASFTWGGLLFTCLMYGPLLLCTVLIHELGHSLAARRAGAETHGILLWPLGGLAFIGRSSGPKADLLISLAGPLTHIPQLAFWLLLYLPVSLAAFGGYHLPTPFHLPPGFWPGLVVGACWMNVSLMVFNLCLPAYPLDGGRILADALLLCGVGEVAAAKVTAVLAVVLGAGVLALGAWQASALTLSVGLWMLFSTHSLVKAIQEGSVGQHPLFSYDEHNPPVVAGYQYYDSPA